MEVAGRLTCLMDELGQWDAMALDFLGYHQAGRQQDARKGFYLFLAGYMKP